MNNDAIYIGSGESVVNLELQYANRHGLIAGATGTGKTVTLQCLAESFSAAGVPVFMADVKGDLSGLAAEGKTHPKITERLNTLSLENFDFHASPVRLWDIYGESGIPVRSTISAMGPELLARLLELNDTQTGVLTVAFSFADDNGLLILDLKDLRAVLQHISDNSKTIKQTYGHVSAASIGAIMRRLLQLERQDAELFFAEPALELHDLLKSDSNGRGIINILCSEKLIIKPQLYATFLLWLLSEVFETFPEVGDQDKPKLVFFLDEAHLLFDDAPKALIDKIEQVIRLIRSKGVSLFFITQSPSDIPDSVLSQLGNRIQHALRAYTPKEQKAVSVAAQTFRQNPKLDTKKVITELGVGEALISVLTAKAVPSIVQRVLIRPPHSQIGPIAQNDKKALLNADKLLSHYEKAFDRHSAYEKLRSRADNTSEGENSAPKPKKAGQKSRSSNRQSVLETFAKSVARAIGSRMGREIIRGVLGSISRR